MKTTILTVVAALMMMSSYAQDEVKAVKQVYDYGYDLLEQRGADMAIPLTVIYHYHGVENQILFNAYFDEEIITPITEAVIDHQGFTEFDAIRDGDTISVSYNLDAYSLLFIVENKWTMFMDYSIYNAYVEESRK